MTRRCVYCAEKHIIGPDYGEPYTDGLCWKAYLRESLLFFFKWQLPRHLRVAETWLTRLAVIYVLVHICLWWQRGFEIVGK